MKKSATKSLTQGYINGIKQAWQEIAMKRVSNTDELIVKVETLDAFVKRLQEDLLFNMALYDLKEIKQAIAALSLLIKKIKSNLKHNPELQRDLKGKNGQLNSWLLYDIQDTLKDLVSPVIKELQKIHDVIKEHYNGWPLGEYAREATIGGMKIVAEDIHPARMAAELLKDESIGLLEPLSEARHPKAFDKYIIHFKAAQELLKRKGLDKLWYGTAIILPEESGKNVETKSGKKIDAAAQYDHATDTIYVHANPDLLLFTAIVHELGHRYYFKFLTKERRANFDQFFQRVWPTSNYGLTSTEEDFAEAFLAYVVEDSSMDERQRVRMERILSDREFRFANRQNRLAKLGKIIL